jgi:hypothetical protein
MSRTYRFRHDEYMVKDRLYEWVRMDEYHYTHYKFYLDPKSKEGKKQIAERRSGKHIMHWNGPAWFRRECSQAPYRARSKRLIHNYMYGKAEDVVIETKPHLPYWY